MDVDMKMLLKELIAEVRGVKESLQNLKMEVPGLVDSAAATDSLAKRIIEYIEHEYHGVK